jgi:trimethylguanosine synthase
VELFKAALQVTSSIALFLPRNVNIQQLQELAWLASPPLPCEVSVPLVRDRM